MATVKGKWEWIDWPQFKINATIEQTVNFTHDGVNYSKMRFRWHNETDIEYIKSDGQVKAIFNDDDLGWYGTDNHFVDFGSAEQTVSDAFYTQLTANASQVSDVELEGNYTQTVKKADGLLKIYPKTKAKNVMLDSSAAGITAEDVQSGIKELNDKIASAEAAAVKPNGTYPEMTVGNAIRLNYSVIASAGTANIGWWKIGKIQKSKITVSNNYSAILLVNGVYGNQGQSYNEPSGILEVDVRNNNNTLNQANACVLAGNLTLSNICLALDGAGDLILYHKLSSEYRIATYTLLTENTKSVFELSASFYGTTAPSSAVYAVYANIASKVNNALTLNINGTATVFDGSSAKTVDITAGGGGGDNAVIIPIDETALTELSNEIGMRAFNAKLEGKNVILRINVEEAGLLWDFIVVSAEHMTPDAVYVLTTQTKDLTTNYLINNVYVAMDQNSKFQLESDLPGITDNHSYQYFSNIPAYLEADSFPIVYRAANDSEGNQFSVTYQKKLIAGNGITIDQSTNTISASGNGGDSEAVKYTQQSLTTEQQQQARTNIAAAGSANTVTTDTEQTISGAKTFNAALNVNSSITGESIVAKTTDFGIMTMAPTPEGFMISTEVNGDPVGILIFDTGFLLPGNSQHGLVSTLAYYEANMETAEVVRVYSPNNKPKPADIGAQAKLIAGTGITIDQATNTISTSGGGSTQPRTKLFRTNEILEKTVGGKYSVSDSSLTPVASDIVAGDIVIDVQGNIGTFDSDYDGTDVNMVTTMYVNSKSYVHRFCIEFERNGRFLWEIINKDPKSYYDQNTISEAVKNELLNIFGSIGAISSQTMKPVSGIHPSSGNMIGMYNSNGALVCVTSSSASAVFPTESGTITETVNPV